MFEWSEEHQMIREAVKRFVDDEIRPHVEELEHGDLPPYDILRKLFLGGTVANINSAIETEKAVEVMMDFDIDLEVTQAQTAEEVVSSEFERREATGRAPHDVEWAGTGRELFSGFAEIHYGLLKRRGDVRADTRVETVHGGNQ